MRAAFSDPQGPRLWRVLPYLAPLLLLLTGIFGPFGSTLSWLLALSGICLGMLPGLVPLRQRRRKPAEITCGAGYIDVKAGTRSQRLLAKSILGASTARTESGFLLTFTHAERDQPIHLEVETEAEVEDVRRALGIGHGGFGTIGWRTVPVGGKKAGAVGRAMVVGLTALIGLAALAGSDAALITGILGGQFIFIGLVLAIVGSLGGKPPPSIVMSAAGLRLQTQAGWFTLPYHLLLDADDRGKAVAFRVPEPYYEVNVPVGGMWSGAWISPDERAALIAQVRAASMRARGMGPLKNDVTGRVDVLRRNHGETPRDWLVRLDMAGQMLASGSGYRGNTLDAEDLWAILEDPEADAELRAAAARVLRHLPKPETRVRIDAAVAAVRDDMVNRKLRVAVSNDVDAASYELATIDARIDARAAAVR